ncbi:hypothetical protein DSM25558_1126 [Agrobacterium sp. DSM 25558]|uniref:hypothetical protein n=1 Tax=Agrobacterium sp. DSM 25558 TaxID=1907665 RepID=UPI00097250F3|nr:hypothetical protein [Agrobacterium sp. DSM 25558]SCX08385.1 hypothetical protein DSM25558_1126 [Agrobacterium sp. DSM 25558]
MTPSSDDKGSVEDIHNDAKGQFAKGLKHSDNNGVASAKPRVITGSDDATTHKSPPGKKPVEKEWDLNYDERETNEGDFRG